MGTVAFFFLPFVVALVGAAIHVKRTDAHGGRALELFLVWWIVANGVMAILGGISHIGPTSDEVAEGIGYVQSMFQWEVGWGDITVGVLLVGVARWRDGWLTAAVVAWAISYWGDAIGHVMEWVSHDNTAPSNTWALPSDILGPLVAVALLIAFRRARQARNDVAA